MHFPNLYEELFYKALRIRLVRERIIQLTKSVLGMCISVLRDPFNNFKLNGDQSI